MKQSAFAGTGTLVRLYIRRDRFLLPVWVLLPLLITMGQANFVTSLPDWQSFVAELNANPLAVSFIGPVAPMNLAGAIIWRSSIQGIMAVIIGSLLTVIRHTRTEEEKGRSELICGGMVGRHAALTAALVLTCSASVVAGLLPAFALIGQGLPAGGSILLGLTMAAAGCFFAGIGALSAQLREHAGSARGIAFAIFGIGFLLFIWNNIGGSYTGWAWLAPLSWHRITRPFDGDRGWALIVFAILSAIPIIMAYRLSIRRDLGSGIFHPRLGPAEASAGLSSPLALAWRMHKAAVISWTVGLIYLGFGIGVGVPSVSNNVSEMMPGSNVNNWLQTMGGVQEAFLAMCIYIIALLVGVSIFSIITVLRLRKEEADNLVEPILAKPISRVRWMASHLAIAFAGSAFLLLMLGLATGMGWGVATGDIGSVLPKVILMSVSKIPSVWVMIGIVSILYGLIPKASSIISWGLLGLFVVIEMAWEFQLVDWSVMKLTPMAYAHYSIPVSQLPVLPLFGLTCLAGIFTYIGMLGFKRRSIF